MQTVSAIKFTCLLISLILLSACGGGSGGGNRAGSDGGGNSGNNSGDNGGSSPDTTAPVLQLIGQSPVNIPLGGRYIEEGATAVDNVDGSVNVDISGEVDTGILGRYMVTYTASDAAGNNAFLIRVVNVVDADADVLPPVITILGENPINIELGSGYVDAGAAAQDDVDGALAVVTDNTVNITEVGAYLVNYVATDSAENQATASRTVNVIAPERALNASCRPPEASVGEPDSVGFEAGFPNLPSLSSPLAMVQPPRDSSFWLVALREGQIAFFENSASVTEHTTVLDIRDKVSTALEMGLTGLAIHPNYPDDNRVFIIYNDQNAGRRSTLSSFRINTTTHIIDPDSEVVQLTLDQPANNHNGGDMAFGPDGMLYLAFGDGGFDWDESQRLFNLHGAMLRLDVNGETYTVPEDNPFNTGQPRCRIGARAGDDETSCPEIFAYGLRNPWRWSFDRQTGDIWLADVGEDRFEEVNRIQAGGNYGWPIMEADSCFGSDTCNMTGLTLPITQYPRSVGVSTVGGYVYRGTESPSLFGQYIWGDTFSSQFLSIPASAQTGDDFTLRFNSGRLIAGMAEGNDGEIYLLNLDGGEGDGIYRVTASGGGGGIVNMPQNLSEVGCFDTQEKIFATGVFDYDVQSQLWSDGAAKQRAFAIPNSQRITVLSGGDFQFPTDSILIKHFLNGDIYLETRFLVNHSTGWAGYTYEWRDDQTDAVLLTEGKTKDVGEFIHTYPSSAECSICHTNAANISLGIESAQLNLSNDMGVNQLEFLSAVGYLSENIDHENQPRLYSINDTSATLTQRARSYLHSNCSGCHRPGAAADFIDLRYNTALADTNTCGMDAELGDLGVAGAQKIMPGNADASVILLRMQTLGAERMPPLASLREDTHATALIRDWINGLSGCN